MSLRCRHGKWHYRFKVNGHEWAGPTGLAATERNRKQAEQIEAEAWKAVKRGQLPHDLQIDVVPFSEAAVRFLLWVDGHHRNKPNTVKRVHGSFTSLTLYFGRKPVSAITQGDVTDFVAWRKFSHHVRDVTIRHDVHNLSKFFKYAIKHNWCKESPVLAEDIPSDEGAVRMHIFTPSEEQQYLQLAQYWPKLHDLCRLMLYQGCRPEELLGLEIGHVDLERRYLRIEDGKSNASKRRLRIRPESMEIFARLVQHPAGRYLFVSERNPKGKLSLSSVENWHVKVRAQSGIPCVIYDWRHTFATRAAESGMSLATLASILGHSNLRSVMKYVHPSQEEQDRALDRLSESKVDQGRTTLSHAVIN